MTASQIIRSAVESAPASPASSDCATLSELAAGDGDSDVTSEEHGATPAPQVRWPSSDRTAPAPTAATAPLQKVERTRVVTEPASQPELTLTEPHQQRSTGVDPRKAVTGLVSRRIGVSAPGTYTLGVVVSALVLGIMLGALVGVLAASNW